MSNDEILIEVAFAAPEKQIILPLHVKRGTTMYDAVMQSNIGKQFEGLDVELAPMGVFGKAERKPKERVLREGERVEIYRPLIADPKEVRKKRAAEKAAKDTP